MVPKGPKKFWEVYAVQKWLDLVKFWYISLVPQVNRDRDSFFKIFKALCTLVPKWPELSEVESSVVSYNKVPISFVLEIY